MQMPLQVSFHNLPLSEPLAEWIRRKAAKLEERYPRLVGCKVAVEEPNHHHRQGKGRHFRIRVELSVPGELLVADREAPQISEHEDAYLAITKAFEAAQRQLDAFAERTEGRMKSHQSPKTRSRPWLRS
ncbi:MAG: HPF/RaiA family ribosome-associated protein [Myxococcales bacterium]